MEPVDGAAARSETNQMTSSCLCGGVLVSYEVAGQGWKFVCHCTHCYKLTGATFSPSVVVDFASIRYLRGDPKLFTLNVESGNAMTSYFCPDCGGLLFRRSEGNPDRVAMKVGLIDTVNGDQARGREYLENYRPDLEIYCRSKIGWSCSEWEGVAKSADGTMPELRRKNQAASL